MAYVNPVQVQKFLGGLDYPATTDEIVNYARQHGADDNVIETLQSLPEDAYDSPTDLSEAIGEIE